MAYVEATVIVDGAIEVEATFQEDEQEAMSTWVSQQRELAVAHRGQTTEIYLLQHDHPSDVEDCNCGQYVTDHHPHWTTTSNGH